MTSSKPKALLLEIKQSGRCPIRKPRASTDEEKQENNLAKKLWKTRNTGWLLPEHDSEIELLGPEEKSFSVVLLQEIK